MNIIQKFTVAVNKNHVNKNDKSEQYYRYYIYLSTIDIIKVKKDGKDQETIQSSTTPHPGVTKIQNTSPTRAKRSSLSQQVTTRQQRTEAKA